MKGEKLKVKTTEDNLLLCHDGPCGVLFANDRKEVERTADMTPHMPVAVFFVLLFTFSLSLFNAFSEAAIFDRIVAFVDDQAITLSELREQFEATRKLSPDITREEVLDTMINRMLLLREAKKYRIEAPSKEQMLNEYIDLKVRAFIRVNESDMEAFYNQNRDKFADKTYEDAREEIEKYLTEKELNVKLKETLKELRKNAYIKVQLQPER